MIFLKTTTRDLPQFFIFMIVLSLKFTLRGMIFCPDKRTPNCIIIVCTRETSFAVNLKSPFAMLSKLIFNKLFKDLIFLSTKFTLI